MYVSSINQSIFIVKTLLTERSTMMPVAVVRS